jgi:heme/copper-type cytochrome/quinol oxidase subunit 4
MGNDLKNIKFYIMGILFILFIALIPYMGVSILTLVHKYELRSIIIPVVFIVIQILYCINHKTDDKSTNKALMFTFLFISVMFAVFFNIEGNSLYNKPLEWIVSPFGTLSSVTNVEQFGSTISWSTLFSIVQKNGTTIPISYIFIILYRAVQYTILLRLIWFLNDKTLVRFIRSSKRSFTMPQERQEEFDNEMIYKIEEEMQRRKDHENTKRMVSEELYNRLKYMKETGNTIRAIKMLRDETEQAYTLGEAKKFIDDL